MRYLTICLLSIAPIGAIHAESPMTQTDVRLNGEWIVESTESHGNQTEDFNGSRFRIDGNSFEWTIGKRILHRILVVDRTVQPNSFDQFVTTASEQKTSILGIYKFERNKLMVCFTNPSRERPRNFETALGTAKTTLVLRRSLADTNIAATPDGG